MSEYIRKHLMLSEDCLEIIQEIMVSDPWIRNESQAVRYLLLKHFKESQHVSSQSTKSEAIMKQELSVLRVMVASIGDALQTPVINNEGSEFYSRSTDIVSDQIKRAITMQREKEFYN